MTVDEYLEQVRKQQGAPAPVARSTAAPIPAPSAAPTPRPSATPTPGIATRPTAPTPTPRASRYNTATAPTGDQPIDLSRGFFGSRGANAPAETSITRAAIAEDKPSLLAQFGGATMAGGTLAGAAQRTGAQLTQPGRSGANLPGANSPLLGGITNIAAGLAAGGKNIVDRLLKNPNPTAAGSDIEQAINMLKSGQFAQAGDIYSPFSPSQERWEAESQGDETAKFLSQHPLVNMAASFVGGFAEPVNYLGGPISQGLGKLATMTRAEKALSAVTQYLGMNRFGGVRNVGGVEGEAAVRNLLISPTQASGEAQAVRREIFGPNPTNEQKQQIVAASQGDKTYLGKPLSADVIARGLQLRTAIKNMDIDQLQRELIKPDDMFASEIYFPMQHAYVNKLLDPEQQLAEQNLRTGIFARSPIQQRAGTSAEDAESKVFKTLNEAATKGELRPDWDPAEQFQNWYSQRRQNILVNDRLSELPQSLRRDVNWSDFDLGQSEVSALGQTPEQRIGSLLRGSSAPKWNYELNRPTTDYEQMMHAIERNNELYANNSPYRVEMNIQGKTSGGKPLVRGETLQEIGSPILKRSLVSEEVAKVLKAVPNLGAQDAKGLGAILDSFNNLTRIGVLTNPIIHPGFNLLNNFLGAGGDLRDLVGISKELDAAAKAAGAHVEMGATKGIFGTPGARLETAPSELSPMQRIERAGTQMWEWNQRVVFDVAEKAFSNALYKKFIEKGMSPAEAGIQVRKAFGDSLNVSPTGIERTFNRLFFFYPWLKTIIPFWASTAIKNPGAVGRPINAMRTERLTAGDPNAQGERPTSDFTLYFGQNKEGNPRYWSVPLPQRILAQASTPITGAAKIATGQPGGLEEMFKGPSAMALGHLNPLAGTLYDMAYTGLRGAEDPTMGGNFHTIFDKDAPNKVKLQQAGAYLAQKLGGPIPLERQIAGLPDWLRQIQREGIDAGEALALSGGTEYTGTDPVTNKALYRARKVMERNLRLHKDDPDAMADDYASYATLRDSYVRPWAQGGEPSTPQPSSTPSTTTNDVDAYLKKVKAQQGL